MTDRHMQEAREIMARGRMNYGLDMQEVIAAALAAAEKRGREEERERIGTNYIKSILERCEGSDDPEERCPRHPSDCVCWKLQAAIRARKAEP